MSDGRCPCCGAAEWCPAENAKADARERDPHPECTLERVRELEAEVAWLREELERSRHKGCGSYPRALGEIEGLLGITRAVPLSETVDAVRSLSARVAELERNQVTSAMQAEFELGKEQRDKLRARVEDLESRLQDAQSDEAQQIARLTGERHELANAIADHWRPRAESAESALASARVLLERWQSDEPIGGIAQRKLKSDTATWLASHLTPAAAREIHPTRGEDPATCQHLWERHLWERGQLYCPHCHSVKARTDKDPTPGAEKGAGT